MSAVWFLWRAELRRRWRSWLALAVLVAIVGGLALAAAAAGRRTASAFPRYVRRYGYDSFVYSEQPLPKLPTLPEVASSVELPSPGNGPLDCGCTRQLKPGSSLSVFEGSPSHLSAVVKVLSGRLPRRDALDEVAISFTLQRDLGLHVGSVIRIPFFSSAQAAAVATGSTSTIRPTGPTVRLRVVGIDAIEIDFPSVGSPSYSTVVSPALGARVNPRTIVFDLYAVRLRRGFADIPRFDRDVTVMGAGGEGGQESGPTIASAIHPQAVGWWLLAAVSALAGVAAIGQALNRQSVLTAPENVTVAALGAGRRQLVLVGVLRAASAGLAGALGAIAVAYAASSFAPIGEARIAEPSPGRAFDLMVLGLGSLGLVLLVIALGVWPAIRDSRVLHRSTADEPHGASRVVTALTAAGAPPTAVIGIRRGLERGRGRDALPAWNALVGTCLAVASLAATVVFGASLSRLTTTPRLYGQAFQMWLSGIGQNISPAELATLQARLQHDPAVVGLTLGTSGAASINGVGTDVIAGEPLRGPLLVSSASGRAPARVGEVALGEKTLALAHAHVGSTVRVTSPLANGGELTSNVKVVGTASFPPDFGVVGLNRGAIFTVDGFIALQCPPGRVGEACRETTGRSLGYVYLVAVRPGLVGRRAIASYVRDYPAEVALPVTPAKLVSFGQAVNFPLILGLVLVIFAIVTLVHVLVVSIVRRRREVALLKTLGFVRRQVVAAMCWQATTVALVGTIIGVPAGVVAGRALWQAFATDLGVVPLAVVAIGSVVLLAVAVVVAANLLAVVPAVVAANAPPAGALRTE